MLEVGQLGIAGSLDTKGIDDGFDRVKGKFRTVENQSNQTNASLSNMQKTGKMLATTLAAAGVAGMTALTGLATKSPLLANTFAKIDVNLLRLSNTIGSQLRPVFEGFNNLISSFNSFLGGGMGGSPESIFKGAVAGGGAGAIAGGIIGFMIGGPAGIILGATLGATIGSAAGAMAGKEISEFNQNIVQPIKETYSGYSDVSDAAGLTGAKATAFNFAATYIKTIQNWIASINDKEFKMTSSDGITRG